jgi:hypothetical protein
LQSWATEECASRASNPSRLKSDFVVRSRLERMNPTELDLEVSLHERYLYTSNHIGRHVVEERKKEIEQ